MTDELHELHEDACIGACRPEHPQHRERLRLVVREDVRELAARNPEIAQVLEVLQMFRWRARARAVSCLMVARDAA